MSGLIGDISSYVCFYVSGLALGVSAVSFIAPEATPVAAAFSSIAMVSAFVLAAIKCDNSYSIASAAFSMASLGCLAASALHDNNIVEHIMGIACAAVAFVINSGMISFGEGQPEVSEQLV